MLQSRSGHANRRLHRGFSLLEALIVVAVTLVLVAMASKGFLRAQYTYSINSAARQVGSVIQLARSKATARNNRYQVQIDTTSGTYSLMYCSAQNLTATPVTCDAYALDSPTAQTNLPAGVTFVVPAGVTVAPVGAGAPSQAANMTFNSRGLLIDNSSPTPIDLRCFYLARTGVKAMAVCTTLSGRTAIYALNAAGTGWNEQ